MHFYHQFDTPVGSLVLVASESHLLRLYFPNTCPKEIRMTATPLLKEGQQQLLAYFSGELREFSLPYQTEKSQTACLGVLSAIAQIPYGEVWTYGQVGSFSAYPPRAVGRVCHSNRLPIIVPCHRVCGKDGTLKGYAGGLSLKKYLLDLENPHHGYTVN
ncbi:MAG: methylated-DNA--[protein]-cysteine S-methyltransferase [Eubacteriales bacterium]